MEFLQFHPTALATGDDPMPLLTEALRGEGATIIDERGHRFLHAVHPLAELAPRDVVARALWRHGQAGHQTLLDARALGADLELRFPRVIGLCQRAGLDPRHEPMPVAPAAHYHMGGVAVDPDGRATVNGLWACGEVAHTGLHGANRLASNSLLEALVCGARLGRALAAEHRVTNGGALFDSADRIPARRVNGANGAMHSAPRTGPGPFGPQDTGAALLRLRHIMWRHCGLERNEAGLHQALSELTTMEAELCPGDACLENALITAQLITRAALMRGESRGAHFRTDHPSTKIQWNRTLYVDGLGRDQPMVAGH